MASKEPSAAQVVVRQWLNEHMRAFEAILEDVAEQVAPIVAQEALARITAELTLAGNSDWLISQMVTVLQTTLSYLDQLDHGDNFAGDYIATNEMRDMIENVVAAAKLRLHRRDDAEDAEHAMKHGPLNEIGGDA